MQPRICHPTIVVSLHLRRVSIHYHNQHYAIAIEGVAMVEIIAGEVQVEGGDSSLSNDSEDGSEDDSEDNSYFDDSSEPRG